MLERLKFWKPKTILREVNFKQIYFCATDKSYAPALLEGVPAAEALKVRNRMAYWLSRHEKHDLKIIPTGEFFDAIPQRYSKQLLYVIPGTYRILIFHDGNCVSDKVESLQDGRVVVELRNPGRDF